MAERGERRIVDQTVFAKPPASEQRGYERCDETADVDEYVEDLEAGVTLRCISRVVIQLTDDCLQVSFEKAVSECYQEECAAGEGEEPCLIFSSCENREGEQDITGGHYAETGYDSALVVAGLVSDKTAYKAQYVYSGIEAGIDDCACLLL